MGALLDLAKRARQADQQAALSPAVEAHAPVDAGAEDRKARALTFLEAHPNVKRACFADVKADPIILTIALREPWGTVEVLIMRERFDAVALMELSLRCPGTSLFVPEH